MICHDKIEQARMAKFIIYENIKHYTAILATDIQGDERKIIHSLLKEERAKQIAMSRNGHPRDE